MAKHTPGPWKKNAIGLYGSDGSQVLATAELGLAFQTPSGDGGETRRANNRLIAAAPEMYEALRKIRDQEQHGDNSAEAHMHDMADIARAILAKIEGAE